MIIRESPEHAVNEFLAKCTSDTLIALAATPLHGDAAARGRSLVQDALRNRADGRELLHEANMKHAALLADANARARSDTMPLAMDEGGRSDARIPFASAAEFAADHPTGPAPTLGEKRRFPVLGEPAQAFE